MALRLVQETADSSVCPTAGLDVLEKTRVYCSAGNRTPDSSTGSPVTTPTEIPGIKVYLFLDG